MISNNHKLIDAIHASRSDIEKSLISQILLEFMYVIDDELGMDRDVWIMVGTLHRIGGSSRIELLPPETFASKLAPTG